MISGGPGTGKTAVALHRAAYLLYPNRRRFESGGVLVVGPSNVFMSYIERVLPSLGEDAATLRPIGRVAADVVRLRGDRLDPTGHRRGQGQPADGEAAASAGARAAGGRPERAPAHHQGPCPPAARPGLAGSGATPWPTTRSTSAGQPRSGAAERTVAGAPARPRAGAGRVRRAVHRDRYLRALLAAPGGRRSPRPPCSADWPTRPVRRLPGGLLSNAERGLLAASYADLGERPDWTVADGALLDELGHLLGPVPEPEEPEVSQFLDPDAEAAEVVTTADRLSAQRESDPFADTSRRMPTSWSTRRRTSRRCSGGCSGAAAPAPAGPSSAIRRRAPGPTRRRPSGRSPRCWAPRRSAEFRMSTNYRNPAEVFALASQVVRSAYPQADLPQAVRSTGSPPRLRRRPRTAWRRLPPTRYAAAVRGRRHRRCDRPPAPAGGADRGAGGPAPCGRTGSGWSARPGRRVWSTTRCW